jgi:hypothetical protein
MLSFKRFHTLSEGGNIKVGDVSANEIAITPKNRSQVAGDIHGALKAMHDSYNKATGNHLLGKGAKALSTGSAFSGSTHHLMDSSIGDEEFAKHKPIVGDLDIKVNKDHADDFAQNHLKPGTKYGKYTVVGTKKGAGTHHVLMRHDNGSVHQFDLMKGEYSNHEPTEFEKFSHSSNWEDVKAGIKGMHHKILLNAAGGDKHKFSVMHGLGSRTDEKAPWVIDKTKIAHTLFGSKAEPSKMDSFHGVAQLIKKHIPAERHQEIYDKFKSSLAKMPGDHAKAIAHLKNTLSAKD